MSLFEQYGVNTEYVILGLGGGIIILLLLIIILMVKQSKLNKKYKQFMKGTTAENLEGIILEKLKKVEDVDREVDVVNEHLKKVDENLLNTYEKLGIVKYDAFKEMGGKLSFALALLNGTNDGFIMNCMHSSREGCYTYVKEILKGESFILLADEEREALELAKKQNNFME